MTAHPKDRDFLLLRTPPDVSELIRRTFSPAQKTDVVGEFVLPADKLGALQTWARFNGVRLLNEITQTGEARPAVQCDNVIEHFYEGGKRIEVKCATPYRASRIPRFCSVCGQPTRPVAFRETAPIITTTKCEACGHSQSGRDKYCAGCGAVMVYAEEPKRPSLSVVLGGGEDRTRLADPVPLNKGWRPVEDVELPDPTDGDDPWRDGDADDDSGSEEPSGW